MRVVRIILCGIAAGGAWWLGFQLLFMPAQAILADPSLQSEKFLSVFFELEPPPHTAQRPWLLTAAFFVFGTIHVLVYQIVAPSLPSGRIIRGLQFGAISWSLCFPWFEFYLPWNVMREPMPLVALELVLWAGVMALEGLVISFAAPAPRRLRR